MVLFWGVEPLPFSGGGTPTCHRVKQQARISETTGTVRKHFYQLGNAFSSSSHLSLRSVAPTQSFPQTRLIHAESLSRFSKPMRRKERTEKMSTRHIGSTSTQILYIPVHV
jgi:hypothetical protein